MAYYGYRLPYVSMYQTYLDVCAAITNMGWVLHDQGLKAFGTLTSNGTNVTNGSTVSIDGKTYVFRNILTAEGEVLIGGNASASLDNLKAAINHTGTPDTDYKCAEAHPTCTAEDKTDTTLKIQSKIYGNIGRYSLSKNTSTLTVSSANLSGDTPTVYKSNGEDGDRPYGYISIWPASSSLYFYTYLYWDASTHTGTLNAYMTSSAYANINSNAAATKISGIYGDKNLVYVTTSSSGTYNYSIIFGHLKPIQTQITVTTNAISTGSHVSIPVASSSGFAAGMVVQIVGLSEGRDKLVVESIPDNTHITVLSLPRNFATGAFIGAPAMCFGAPNTTLRYNFYDVASWPQTGTTACTSSDFLVINSLLTNSYIDPDSQTLNYTLSPIVMIFNSSAYIATMGDNFYASYGLNIGDVVGINTDGSKSASNSCTLGNNTMLTDSTKEWTPDSLIGKYVVISDGTGVGQIRRILDNDETTLTVTTWILNPDNTSTYRIVDEAWRVLESSTHISGYQLLCRETDHVLS